MNNRKKIIRFTVDRLEVLVSPDRFEMGKVATEILISKVRLILNILE